MTMRSEIVRLMTDDGKTPEEIAGRLAELEETFAEWSTRGIKVIVLSTSARVDPAIVLDATSEDLGVGEGAGS